MTGTRRPCVFFDRDGVVNRSPGDGYVLSPEAFFLNEGIAPALRLLRERGVAAVVVTSQRGVGKGLMTREDLERIHRRMAELLAAEEVAFDGVFAHCGDASPDDFPPKPDPGMIYAAEERFGLELRRSWLIGDADRDIEMGIAAGLSGTIRIRGEKAIGRPANHTLNSPAEILNLLELIL